MAGYRDKQIIEYWFSCYSFLELEEETSAKAEKVTEEKSIVYYDVETQKHVDEIGGWDFVERMLISVAVTYSTNDGFKVWQEPQVSEMIAYMTGFDLITSYNGDRFDRRRANRD